MSHVVLTATLTFKPEFTAMGIGELRDLHTATHAKDKGCIQYDLHVKEDDINTFVFIETWESEEALTTHSEAEHSQKFRAFIEGKLASSKLEKLIRVI